MDLQCECGSKYFIRVPVTKYSDTVISAHTGYRSTEEAVNVFMCLNSKCKKVIIPELSSFNTNKEDLRIFEEMISTEGGEPKEIPGKGVQLPKHGEIVRAPRFV